MDETKVDKMEKIMTLLNEGLTRSEFEEAFHLVLDAVEKLKKDNSGEFDELHKAFQLLSEKVKADAQFDVGELKEQVTTLVSKALKEQTDGLDLLQERVRSLKDGEPGVPGTDGAPGVPGKDGSPDTGDQIITKINRADLLIERSAIAGMEEIEKKIDEKTKNTVRVGWGAHPLTIQGLGITIDKNTRVVNFKGTGVSSVTRRPDGVVEVTLTAGGGSSGTRVSEEIPTDSGDHLHFTLAHSPNANTLYIYRGGARQASIGTSPDYSSVGTALTLSTALSTAQGEILLASYEYT